MDSSSKKHIPVTPIDQIVEVDFSCSTADRARLKNALACYGTEATRETFYASIGRLMLTRGNTKFRLVLNHRTEPVVIELESAREGK